MNEYAYKIDREKIVSYIDKNRSKSNYFGRQTVANRTIASQTITNLTIARQIIASSWQKQKH